MLSAASIVWSLLYSRGIIAYNSPLSYTGLQSGDGNLCLSVVGCVCVCVCVCEMLACVQRGKRKPSTFNRISPIFLVKPAFTDFYLFILFFSGHLWAAERRSCRHEAETSSASRLIWSCSWPPMKIECSGVHSALFLVSANSRPSSSENYDGSHQLVSPVRCRASQM